MQLYNHGRILDRTIYDRNEWILHDDYAECITYDINFNPNGRVKFDLDDYDRFKDYKVYIRNHNGKYYAVITIDNRKYFVHRVILSIEKEEFNINKVVDHINGDSLDNRKSNLRICSHSDNMKNIRKRNRFVGVSESKDGRFMARIMHDYKTINIGLFDTFEEAVLARLKKEVELCGEYGSNKDLHYILENENPIGELKKYFNNNK